MYFVVFGMEMFTFMWTENVSLTPVLSNHARYYQTVVCLIVPKAFTVSAEL